MRDLLKRVASTLTAIVFGLIMWAIMMVAAFGLLAVVFVAAIVTIPFATLGRVFEIFN